MKTKDVVCSHDLTGVTLEVSDRWQNGKQVTSKKNDSLSLNTVKNIWDSKRTQLDKIYYKDNVNLNIWMQTCYIIYFKYAVVALKVCLYQCRLLKWQ